MNSVFFFTYWTFTSNLLDYLRPFKKRQHLKNQRLLQINVLGSICRCFYGYMIDINDNFFQIFKSLNNVGNSFTNWPFYILLKKVTASYIREPFHNTKNCIFTNSNLVNCSFYCHLCCKVAYENQ